MTEPFRPLPWQKHRGESVEDMPIYEDHGGPYCDARSSFSARPWYCTEPQSHAGHHRAGTGRCVIAEWEA